MLAEATKDQSFTPIKLTLILQTQAEVDAMYAVMNHTRITEGVGLQSQSDLVRDQLRKFTKDHLAMWTMLDNSIKRK